MDSAYLSSVSIVSSMLEGGKKVRSKRWKMGVRKRIGEWEDLFLIHRILVRRSVSQAARSLYPKGR